MMERPHIRVNMTGKEVRRELIVKDRKVADLSYVDVVSLIARAADAMREKQPFEIVPGYEIGFTDTLEFGAQAYSSLRYEADRY